MKKPTMINGFVNKASMPAMPSIAKKSKPPMTQAKKMPVKGYSVKPVTHKGNPFA